MLAVAVTLDHYTLDVAGARIKLEHVVLAALLALGAVAALRGRRPPIPGALLWIPAWLLVTALASLVNAPAPATSLRHTAMLALVTSGAFVTYALLDSPARLRRAVGLLAGLGVLEALAALGAAGLAQLGGTWGTQPGFIGTRVPYGTLWEANILGSYLAAAGTLLVFLLLAARRLRPALILAGGLAVLLVALGLSATRAAWVAFPLGVAAGLAALLLLPGGLPRPRRPVAVNTALGAGAFGLAVAALLLTPAVLPRAAQGLAGRTALAIYDPRTDPSVAARAGSLSTAWAGIAAHPILGNGAGSFAAVYSDAQGEPGWLSNLELHLLYDSGLLGLGLVLAGAALLVAGAWRGLRRGGAAAAGLVPSLAALLAVGVVLGVAYQTTEATWLGYTWVYAGLLARAAQLANASAPAGSGIARAGQRPGTARGDLRP